MDYNDYMDSIKDSADADAEWQEYLEGLPDQVAKLSAELAEAERRAKEAECELIRLTEILRHSLSETNSRLREVMEAIRKEEA
jgi:hypothetical protein